MSGPDRNWDSAYSGAPPPWDIGLAQPIVVRLADEGAFRGHVLDAGCGTGENALELASRGLETWGVDGAPLAIEKARTKATNRRLATTFVVGDALELTSLGQTFDSILDCGLYHTFDDSDRARYVESLASVMASGGVLHLLCFSDLEPGTWGPRRITQAELRASFDQGWRVVSIEPAMFDTLVHADGARAWLAWIERAG